MKICIIVANYYPSISKNLIAGADKILKSNGIKNTTKIIAPGVLEIPTIISKKIYSYDGIVALGCVIKGQTPHFDFISRATINALVDLSISHRKPIGNGIITCLNKKQALVRSNPLQKNKGGEAAKAVLSILKIAKNDS